MQQLIQLGRALKKIMMQLVCHPIFQQQKIKNDFCDISYYWEYP